MLLNYATETVGGLYNTAQMLSERFCQGDYDYSRFSAQPIFSQRRFAPRSRIFENSRKIGDISLLYAGTP